MKPKKQVRYRYNASDSCLVAIFEDVFLNGSIVSTTHICDVQYNGGLSTHYAQYICESLNKNTKGFRP